MLAGLAAAVAVVVLLPLAFCCFCPKKSGSAKKAKKRSKAKGEESPATAEDSAKADEPILIKKQKKAKASDEEIDAKKAEAVRRKECIHRSFRCVSDISRHICRTRDWCIRTNSASCVVFMLVWMQSFGYGRFKP
eukprot:symbB.v1.2.013179.t1/scaffold926.1/size151523/6